MSASVLRPVGFAPWEISALRNHEVIDQHAEDAAFLWTQRDRAALAPNYTLKDLAKLDERVEANIDGLRVAGPAGWESCVALLDLGPGELFAAAVPAFESGDSNSSQAVLDIGTAKPVVARALISALGWITPEQMSQRSEGVLRAESAELRRVGIAGCLAHRRDPGPELLRATFDSNARLRGRALEGIAELGRTDLLGLVLSHLSDADPHCRFLAAWSAARLGMRIPTVLEVLKGAAESGGPDAERAMDMLMRILDVRDAEGWRVHLKRRPETMRLAIIGAGALGTPAAINELIASMEDPKLARVAGDAVSMITGADLGYEDLDADEPEGWAEVKGEESGETEVIDDRDEDLQWPSPSAIALYWMKRRGDFRGGIRYLRGLPIDDARLRQTLVEGTQRQRAAAALEIALRHPEQVLFEVRERGDRQLERVKQWIS